MQRFLPLVYVVFIALVLNAKQDNLIDACNKSGGMVDSKGCYCQSTMSYIDSGKQVCFENLALKYSKNSPDKAAALKALSTIIKKNKDIGYENPKLELEEEEQCQMGQLDESFSDFMAIESYILEESDPLEQVRASTKFSANFIDLKRQLEIMPSIAKTISFFCITMTERERSAFDYYDSHPYTKDRLNCYLQF
jgi:hypothetical protein